MSSSITPSIHQNVVPSEVGWQFVPQYYTYVNNQPSRLHCFYTKSSTFVHGTEGEESKPCFGQHEIHEKITSIGFQDCRVFIHSVDAQASANGGIIIQVIGEMSNRGEPWRKFVQTFFLAEQPNGYFVLNDIFRFLKEESVESDDADESAEQEATPAESEPTALTLAPEVPQTASPAREPTPPAAVPVPAAAAAPSPAPSFPTPTEEPPTNDVPEPVPQPPTPVPESQPAPAATPAQPNGHTAVSEPEKPAPPVPAPPAIAEKSPAPTSAPQPTPTSTITAPPPPAPAPAAPTAPPAQPVTPATTAPSAPQSWASLAASNQKKWGAVAQESRGLTETPASPAPSSGTRTPAAATTTTSTTSTPLPRGPSNRSEHSTYQATQDVITPHVFIKGVIEPVTDTLLNNTLSRFGPLRNLEVARNKYCAFGEFHSVDVARRAITASLSHAQGGGGGVFIDVDEDKSVRIIIESRKDRSDRPPARPRGGAPPVNGGESGGRGGHQGGGSAYRGGRGGMRRGGPPAGK